MERGRAAGISRPINLAAILFIYFVVCLLSTTGVDVLVLLTATLLVWATLRQWAGEALAGALATVLGMLSR